jgi:hypothetical protein
MSSYADLTNLIETLKYNYGEGLKNQFPDEKLTYNQFPKSERKPVGLGYVFGVRYARAQSVGARVESAALPAPFTGKKDQGTIVPRYVYGVIRITGPAMAAGVKGPGAFVNSLADEMEDIYQGLLVDMNRQAHWDGFGKVGTVSASFAPSTSTTYAVTFDNDLGITYMQEGMLIDFFDTSGALPVSSCHAQRIYSITPSTKVVVFETSGEVYSVNHPNATFATYSNDTTAVPTASVAVKSGSRDVSWVNTDTPVEITGLEGLYDDGTLLATFENVTVASNPKWSANVMGNSSVNRELSLDLMLNAVDLTRTRSGLQVKKIRMGLGQRRKYANLLMADVRFAPTVLKGGYETLTFSGGDGSLEMVIDPMTQPGKIYFEPDGIIQKYELVDLGWGEVDGLKMRQRAGYDEYDMFLRLYTNLGCEQRNGLTVIKDLVEPTLY